MTKLFYTDFFPVFTEVKPDRFNSKLSIKREGLKIG